MNEERGYQIIDHGIRRASGPVNLANGERRVRFEQPSLAAKSMCR